MNKHARKPLPSVNDLRNALIRAIDRATPELTKALEWLESTAYGRDIDDERLARANAQDLLAYLAQPEGELPLDIYRAANVEGALMDEDKWEAEYMNEQASLDAMMGDDR